MKKIYMDHNATTPIHPDVIKAMMPYFENVFGNPSSIHEFGQEARKALEESREKVARLLGALPEEIVFTGSGTEADNLAIKGICFANESRGKHIITSSIEHHAVLNTCKYMEKMGFKVTYLSVDKHGIVNPEDVAKAITKETIFISIMGANNETGTIEPIEEIGRIAKEKDVYLHTDAVQLAGKTPINAGKMGANLLSISAHKFYGPKGIGLLYIRKGTRLQPQIYGGHHEKNRRAGTENVSGIVGLAYALEIAVQTMGKESVRLSRLRDMLYNGISEKIDRVHLMGHPASRVSNTLNVCFEWIEGESIILNLDLKGIGVSSGSACTSGSLEPSHVLKAMGVDAALAQSSVRFSLGMMNTEEDINYIIEVLPAIVKKLRSMSPLAPH